jgi:hypothetical protein
MLAKVQSGAVLGIDAYIVKVELDISEGLPSFNTVGLPDTAIKEARDRVAAAIKNSAFVYPIKRITANLAPADIRKEGSAFDLPLAVAVLAATGQVSMAVLDKYAILGELSMDGSVRPVKGALPIAVGVRDSNIQGLILPQDNVKEAAVVDGIEVYPVKNLRQTVDVLNGEGDAEVYDRLLRCERAGARKESTGGSGGGWTQYHHDRPAGVWEDHVSHASSDHTPGHDSGRSSGDDQDLQCCRKTSEGFRSDSHSSIQITASYHIGRWIDRRRPDSPAGRGKPSSQRRPFP